MRGAGSIDRAAVVDAYRRNVNAGQAKLAQLMGLPVEAEAHGAYVVDETGTRYLDCGGYGVFLLGHRHPAVVAAVRRQLDRQPLSTKLFLNERLAEAASRLAAAAPAGMERVTFTCSGSEAVELALKLGRATGRARIVAAADAFHGKTLGALSATGRQRYRAPFLPLLPEVDHIPFGDAAALDRALAAGPPATVILEPVQGEAGVRIPPEGYLAAVRASCHARGSLLVVDEIQTGLGRLGTWWGVDRDGVVPDVLLVGKTLGGGVVPAAAVVSTAAAYAAIDNEPLLHTSTFAGNPLAAAAACATIDTMRAEAVVERAASLGQRVLKVVREAVANAGDLVADVRGQGLLVGVEFTTPHHAPMFLEEMLSQRVVVSYSLNADAVVRLTPPVVLGCHDLDWLGRALTTSFGRLDG